MSCLIKISKSFLLPSFFSSEPQQLWQHPYNCPLVLFVSPFLWKLPTNLHVCFIMVLSKEESFIDFQPKEFRLSSNHNYHQNDAILCIHSPWMRHTRWQAILRSEWTTPTKVKSMYRRFWRKVENGELTSAKSHNLVKNLFSF